MRQSKIERNTRETQISLALDLEQSGTCNIDTGCGFLNHMLELFSRHGHFGLEVTCNGDTDVDDHHTVEDIGIVLGQAFSEALGDKRGINRYGSFLLPMDEALVLCALDISGRCCLNYDVQIPTAKVGTFDTELVEEFMNALCRSMGLTLHFKQLAGTNSHHIIEAMFKALGRALDQATSIDSRYANEIPSTKGVL
ncbi:MAG: imidazoleglycerol-phosphate dehydratase HisB [Firmicutes bacterium]|nr:imidazoleglycerol-phosphate dehydratase HisB [Bacillota bacterium]